MVHTHSAKGGALGRMAAVNAGTGRIVHTYHGFPFHEFQPRWRRSAYVRIERWLSRRTDAFLAVGGGVAAEAIRRGLALPDRIRTIAPAVDVADLSVRYGRARTGPAAARAAHRRTRGGDGRPGRLPEGAGALDRRAGNDFRGRRVGGLDRRRAAARPAAGARPQAPAWPSGFCLLGHCDNVGALLPALDVFALASRYEGQPCALIEAMAAGVPVVATAVNAVPDVVIAGESGLLVPPQQPALLGRAIGYLLDEPAQAARMAAYGRELLGDRFTPHTLATVLDQVYDPGRRPGARRGPVAPPRKPRRPPRRSQKEETAWT